MTLGEAFLGHVEEASKLSDSQSQHHYYKTAPKQQAPSAKLSPWEMRLKLENGENCFSPIREKHFLELKQCA